MCEERVRVAARVRPLSLSESERGEAICVSVPDPRSVAIWSLLGHAGFNNHGHTDSRASLVSAGQVAEASSPTGGATFTFDVAFGPAPFLKEEDHQHGIYEELGRPLLQSALEGISGCLFAYGQTGSGKTFSLFGTQAAPGILPRLARELIEKKLKMASDGVNVTVRAAFLEVYNENLVDLLGETRDPLRLFESSSEGVLVPGLSEREIETQHEFSSLLDYATRHRSVGSTCTNEHSSRSHAMIQLKVTVTDKEHTARAKMFLTDLAGSERQKKAKNDGQRMKEGIHINVSLSTLGLVISRLAEIAQGRNHCSVPFRDSKLTFLLKDSLSGNARTEVLIALSPSASSYEESLSTLRFAQSVKKVRTRAVADLVYSSADMVLALQAEVSRLQAELEITRCQKLHPLQFQSPRKTAGSAPATPQHTKTAAGPTSIDTSNFARYGSVDELPVPDGGLLEELDTEKAHDWLQGSYVSPTGRQIEVSREGHVYFGGGGHHPIRICIAYAPSRSSALGGGSEHTEGIARRVRLTSEGDPAYRYVLIAHDQNGVTWRHEDDNAGGNEVRWRREEPLSTDIGREAVLSQAVQEALHTVQLASRASAALAKVAKSTRSWAKSLIPSRGDDAVIEALESLVCLAAKVDEANALLVSRKGGGGSGGSFTATTASAVHVLPPDSPFGEDVLRFEISWLAAELNPELPLSDLLCILVHSLAQSDASPAARKRMQVWSKSDFQLKLKDAQSTVRASVAESARMSAVGNYQTSGYGANGVGPLTLQSLRGRYVTADCNEVAVGADGQVDVAGRRLQLEADGKQARLFCLQERGGRAPLLRLHTRDPCGVLLWEPAVSERLLAQAWRESAISKDNGSEEARQAPADDEVPLVWTPVPVDEAPVVHKSELTGQPLIGSQSQGRLVPSERFVPADCSPRRPPALPGSVLAKPVGSPGSAATNGSNNHNHNNHHSSTNNNNNHSGSNSTPALLSAGGGGAGGSSGSNASGSSIGARARAVLLANKEMMASSPPPPPHSALSSVLQHRRPRSADPGRGRVQSQAEGKSERLQRSPTPVTGRRRRSLSAASSRPKLGVAAGGGEAMVAARSFDKNSLRLRNGAVFVDALEGWRRAHLQPTNPQRPPPNGATVGNNHNNGNTNANSNNHQRRSQLACAVFVRKRPMFEHELRRCDFDVLTVLPLSTASKPAEGSMPISSSASGAASQEIIHHSCMFDKTSVSPFILHTQFTFDGVFDVDTKNEDVYSLVAKPLLEMAAQDGQVATLFVFGQTGSGKTYTMRAMEGAIAADLFGHMASGSQISLTYFELAGRKALDLLTEQKAEIRLREEEDGCFRPHDCTEAVVSSAEELLKVMAEAAGRRATDATTVSASSSRSHSVCRIRIAREGRAAGQLLLVDCAGTERSRDTLYLRGQNVKESAEINSSLFALKDCIRSRHAAMARHQGAGGGLQDGQALKLPSVRATLLTKVLAESLLSPSAQLAAIATVSPNATDSEHTIDTLRIVHTLGGRGEGRVLEVRQSLE